MISTFQLTAYVAILSFIDLFLIWTTSEMIVLYLGSNLAIRQPGLMLSNFTLFGLAFGANVAILLTLISLTTINPPFMAVFWIPMLVYTIIGFISGFILVFLKRRQKA